MKHISLPAILVVLTSFAYAQVPRFVLTGSVTSEDETFSVIGLTLDADGNLDVAGSVVSGLGIGHANLADTAASEFIVYNGNTPRQAVALFDLTWDGLSVPTLYLAGSFAQNQSGLVPPANSFIVQHADPITGNPVVDGYIDSSGNMKIRGALTLGAIAGYPDTALSTSVTPASSGTVAVDPASPQPQFTRMTLTATPNAGYRFLRWLGDITGSVNPMPVFLSRAKTVTAEFERDGTFFLTIATAGSGTGSVTKNPDQGSYASGTPVTLTAVPSAGSRFSAWSGGATGSTNPKSITITADTAVTATFIKTWTLSTTVSPASSGSVSPASGTYDTGAVVSLTATPAAGYRFGSWSGGATGTTNPVTITMDANKSVTATFIRQYTLATTVSPVGGGTVNPASGTYDTGTVVSLTATPLPGFRFGSWSGGAVGTSNPVNVTMNANKTVTANFVVQYTLTTSVSGQGTVSPAGGVYDSGATVWLTATPAAGWRFKEWTGGLTGTTSPALLTMNGNKSVQAVFLPEYTLTVTTWREGTVGPTSGTYISGTNVTVTATPAADTRFDHWEGDVPLGQEQSNPLASTIDTNTAMVVD